MLRMEIALILVLGFVAYIYYSAERAQTALHRTFSALLAAALVHLVFDALTLYTVNHLGHGAAASERRAAPRVCRHDGAGGVSFLSVYCNSGGGGDRKAAQAGLSGVHISGGCCRSAR